jgi:hypothetical protein
VFSRFVDALLNRVKNEFHPNPSIRHKSLDVLNLCLHHGGDGMVAVDDMCDVQLPQPAAARCITTGSRDAMSQVYTLPEMDLPSHAGWIHVSHTKRSVCAVFVLPGLDWARACSRLKYQSGLAITARGPPGVWSWRV